MTAPPPALAWEPERVHVVQIRVCLDRQRCAVPGEFHAADKVLGRWAGEGNSVFPDDPLRSRGKLAPSRKGETPQRACASSAISVDTSCAAGSARASG